MVYVHLNPPTRSRIISALKKKKKKKTSNLEWAQVSPFRHPPPQSIACTWLATEDAAASVRSRKAWPCSALATNYIQFLLLFILLLGIPVTNSYSSYNWTAHTENCTFSSIATDGPPFRRIPGHTTTPYHFFG